MRIRGMSRRKMPQYGYRLGYADGRVIRRKVDCGWDPRKLIVPELHSGPDPYAIGFRLGYYRATFRDCYAVVRHPFYGAFIVTFAGQPTREYGYGQSLAARIRDLSAKGYRRIFATEAIHHAI